MLRGGTSFFFAAISSNIIKLISLVFLARLLSPNEFGALAILASMAGLLESLSLNPGIRMKIISHRGNEDVKYSTANLFVANVIWNLGLGVIAFGTIHIFSDAQYIDQFNLEIVLLFSATLLNNVLNPISGGILTRDLRFSLLAKIEVSSLMLANAVGIILAYSGAGLWSLILRQLVALLFPLAFEIYFCEKFPFKNEPIRPFKAMATTFQVSSERFFSTFVRKAEVIFLGMLFGLKEVGTYSKAMEIVDQASSVIVSSTRSVLPSLSNSMADTNLYVRASQKILTAIAYASFSFHFVIAINGDLIVRALLGNQWISAINYIMPFALARAFLPTSNIINYFAVLEQSNKQMMTWNFWSSIVLLLSILLSSRFGLENVAWAFSFTSIALRIPGIYFLLRNTRFVISSLILSVARPLLVSTVCGILAVAAQTFSEDAFFKFTYSLSAYSAGLIIIAMVFRSIRNDFAFIVRFTKGKQSSI